MKTAKSVRMSVAVATALGLVMQQLAQADVSYQETKRYTGGSLLPMINMAAHFSSQAGHLTEPMTSRILIHGGRMVRTDSHGTQIIDLDQQLITSIDADKHEYTVMTFAQMRDVMNRAAAKGSPAPQSAAGNGANFAVQVQNIADQQIEGQRAQGCVVQVTMTGSPPDSSGAQGGIAVSSSIWSVADVPGAEEMRRFGLRMAHELGVDSEVSPAAGMLSAQPGAAQALADLKKRTAEISGVPVLQVTRVGMTMDGQPLPATVSPPISDVSSVSSAPAPDAATTTANPKPSGLAGLGQALRGSGFAALLGGRAPPDQGDSAASASTVSGSGSSDAQAAQAAAVLLESSTQMSNFSSASVDLSAFQVPQSYKQVASGLEKAPASR